MFEKYAAIKVLKLMLNGEKELSIRDVSKKAKVSVSASKICLDYLHKENILKKKIIGKSHLFSLNKESITAKQMKILANVSEIEKSGIIGEIRDKIPGVLSITLYGSKATGADDSSSDFDILIITSKTQKIIPLKAEDIISKEVNFLIYSFHEWKEKAEKDRIFYDRVILNSITLHGEKPVIM